MHALQRFKHRQQSTRQQRTNILSSPQHVSFTDTCLVYTTYALNRQLRCCNIVGRKQHVNKMTNFQGERRSKVSAPNYKTRNDNQQENNKPSAKHNRHETRHACVTKIQASATINQTTTNKHLIITSACIFHRHMPRLHYLCAKQTVTLLQHCWPYTAWKIK